MNKDQVKGRIAATKGKIKQEAGDLVGNEKLEARGRAQKSRGNAQAKRGDANERSKDAKKTARNLPQATTLDYDSSGRAVTGK